MITLLRFIGCLVAATIGFVITMSLDHNLLGLRGAPWWNFYLFQMPLVWATVILICLSFLSQTVSEFISVALGNWIRGGGFWLVWSKNNVPGNTWVVIALVLALNAVTYGPPTPTVDSGQLKYDTQVWLQKATSQSVSQSAASGAKDTVNYLAQGLLGGELFSAAKSKPALVAPEPRYQKGWWRIWVAFLALIIAPLVWIWGRRDEWEAKMAAAADFFRAKPSESASATSGSGGSAFKALLKSTSNLDRIADHAAGEILARAGEYILGSLAKVMGKY